MRVYVAVLIAVAAFAVLLRSCQDASSTVDGDPVVTPTYDAGPVLAGGQRASPSRTEVPDTGAAPIADAAAVDSGENEALDWKLEVRDKSGARVDPLGLLEVYVQRGSRATWVAPLVTSITPIPTVQRESDVIVQRRFPNGSFSANEFASETDDVSVRVNTKLVLVLLKGWCPGRIEPVPGLSGAKHAMVVFETSSDQEFWFEFSWETSKSRAMPFPTAARIRTGHAIVGGPPVSELFLLDAGVDGGVPTLTPRIR